MVCETEGFAISHTLAYTCQKSEVCESTGTTNEDENDPNNLLQTD